MLDHGQSALIALIDAASAPRLSVYGGQRSTSPFLEQLSEEAVVFEDVTAAAPYTLASVASLFTGRVPDQHRVLVAGDQLPERVQLLPERFHAAGFRTFAVSTNAHVHSRFGFDRGVDRFEWVDPKVGATEFHRVPERLFDVLDEELRRDPQERLFGYLHLMPPHAPYDPPARLRERFAPQLVDATLGSIAHLSPLTVGARIAEAAEREGILALYDASLLYADSCLERLAAQLETSGRDGEFLFTVISDHGEAFGERGLYQHSGNVLESMLRVPWILRFPDRRFAGRRISTPVALVDLVPTLTELFDLEPDDQFAGRSALALLTGPEPTADARALLARTAGPGPYSSVRRGRYKAVYASQNKTWSLYDVEEDFYEQRDLSRREPERLAELQGDLTLALARYRPGALANTRVQLSPELEEQLRAVGYLQELESREAQGDAKE